MRGAWVEMLDTIFVVLYADLSLPVRGAWVEIASKWTQRSKASSLPVRGAWVEISISATSSKLPPSRSPCGERGLKYYRQRPKGGLGGVAPRAGSVG